SRGSQIAESLVRPARSSVSSTSDYAKDSFYWPLVSLRSEETDRPAEARFHGCGRGDAPEDNPSTCAAGSRAGFRAGAGRGEPRWVPESHAPDDTHHRPVRLDRCHDAPRLHRVPPDRKRPADKLRRGQRPP